jgi:DNA-directed RNA polymerase subunit L
MADLKKCIKVVENDPNCFTIEVDEEDHTLGNSLRFMLAKK